MSELDERIPAVAAWRTVIATVLIALLQFVGFLYGTHHGWTNESAAAYGSLCTWTTAAAIGVAAKALGEHLGSGSGFKGAISSLMSDTKPGDPAPVKP